MEWREDLQQENHKLLKEYFGASASWRASAFKMENAKYGQIFSEAEEKMILKFRQAPLPISVPTAILETYDSFMVSARPTISTSPILHPFDEAKNQFSKKRAQLVKQAIQKDWYDSLGALQYDRIQKDRSTTGHGIGIVLPKTDFGEFFTEYKHISWRYFIPDPSTPDPLYRDADALIYAIPLTVKNAFKLAQSYDPDLTEDRFEKEFVKGAEVIGDFLEDQTFGGRKKKETRVWFIYRLNMTYSNLFTIVPTGKNMENATPFSYRAFPKITEQMQKLKAEGTISFEETKRRQVLETMSIGNKGFQTTYPIDSYNIVGFVHDHRDNPYPYGMMWHLYPMARALNKSIMSILVNASILNNIRLLSEDKSLIDEDNWLYNASIPGANIKYRLNIPGISQPPQVIDPKPLSESWFSFPKFLISMMEYVSGIFGIFQGNPDSSPETFSTVASLQSAGGVRIKRRMQYTDAALSEIGRIGAQLYQHYAPINGFASNEFNPRKSKDDPDVLYFNRVSLKESAPGKGDWQVGINPETDLRDGIRDIRFTTEGSSGYEAATQAAMLTNLATQLKLPDLVPAILTRYNFSDLDDIADNLDVKKQLESENDQLKGVVKEVQQKEKILQNQIMNLAVSLERADAKGELKAFIAKFKENPEKYIQEATQFANETMEKQ